MKRGLKLNKKISSIDLNKIFISSEIARLIPSNVARRYCLIPVSIEQDKLYVAMKEPYNFVAIEDVKRACGLDVVPLLHQGKLLSIVYVKFTEMSQHRRLL